MDAIGIQTAVAQAILDRDADSVLAVKANQPRLAESIEDLCRSFRAHQAIHTPQLFAQSVEKSSGDESSGFDASFSFDWVDANEVERDVFEYGEVVWLRPQTHTALN